MIETVFYTTSGGFPMSAILGLCAISALFAMILVAWRDCISFEIDFALLGAAALAMASVILITAGPEALPGALVAAAIAATASWIAWRWKPGRLGLGDIRLMGFVGFAAGPDHAVPVLAALCLFCALTAACYSHIRGKKLFRSMFPAALPGMGAAVLALILRLRDAGLAPFDRMEPTTRVISGGALALGLIAAGITLIAWRRTSWDG